jgi:kynurenine formamidase
MSRPRYSELPGGSARGVFGDGDRLGCLNLLTDERTVAAAALVRSGRVFSLNASLLDYNEPNVLSGSGKTKRAAPKHTVLARTPVNRDDFLDGFYPQSSSQWDHFLHHGDAATGTFYNGVADEPSGIAAWAERGIVGRGVLLDVARFAEAQGDPIDWRTRRTIGPAELRATAAAQAVEIETGTILAVRVGWQQGYDRLTAAERAALPFSAGGGIPPEPGLEASAEMAELLWDWGIAAIGCDNLGLEALPFADESLHVHLLGRLGIPIGELWLLDALAAACAEESRYAFLFVSAPLNVRGGVGSPANALAVL